MKDKLKGGYRKRLSGSRAINENVKLFLDFFVRHRIGFEAPAEEQICFDGKQNRLYKPFSVRQRICFEAPAEE